MLNEEKVILMTRMASYEKIEGKENIKIGSYFRGDYIAVQVLISIACATVVYAIVLGLYVLYHLEQFLEEIYTMDLIAFAKGVLIYYIVFVVSYSVLTYIVGTYRHAKAKRNLKRYYHNLKKLDSLCGEAE